MAMPALKAKAMPDDKPMSPKEQFAELKEPKYKNQKVTVSYTDKFGQDQTHDGTLEISGNIAYLSTTSGGRVKIQIRDGNKIEIGGTQVTNLKVKLHETPVTEKLTDLEKHRDKKVKVSYKDSEGKPQTVEGTLTVKRDDDSVTYTVTPTAGPKVDLVFRAKKLEVDGKGVTALAFEPALVLPKAAPDNVTRLVKYEPGKFGANPDNWVLTYGGPGDKEVQKLVIPHATGFKHKVSNVEMIDDIARPVLMKLGDMKEPQWVVRFRVYDKAEGPKAEPVLRRPRRGPDDKLYTGYLVLNDRGLVVGGEIPGDSVKVQPDLGAMVKLGENPLGELNPRRAVSASPPKLVDAPWSKDPKNPEKIPEGPELTEVPKVEPPALLIRIGPGKNDVIPIMHFKTVAEGRIVGITAPDFETPGASARNMRYVKRDGGKEMLTLLTKAEREEYDKLPDAGKKLEYLTSLAARTTVAEFQVSTTRAIKPDDKKPPGETHTLLIRYDRKGEPMLMSWRGEITSLDKDDPNGLAAVRKLYVASSGIAAPGGYVHAKDFGNPDAMKTALDQKTRLNWYATAPAVITALNAHYKNKGGPAYGMVYFALPKSLSPGAVLGLDRSLASFQSLDFEETIDFSPAQRAEMKKVLKLEDSDLDQFRAAKGSVHALIKIIRARHDVTEEKALEMAKPFLAQPRTGVYKAALERWPKLTLEDLRETSGDGKLLAEKLALRYPGENAKWVEKEIAEFRVQQLGAAYFNSYPIAGWGLFQAQDTYTKLAEQLEKHKFFSKDVAAAEAEKFITENLFKSPEEFRKALAAKDWRKTGEPDAKILPGDAVKEVPAFGSKLAQDRDALVALVIAKYPDKKDTAAAEVNAFYADNMVTSDFAARVAKQWPKLAGDAKLTDGTIPSPMRRLAIQYIVSNDYGKSQLLDFFKAHSTMGEPEAIKETEAFFKENGTKANFVELLLAKYKDKLKPSAAEAAKKLPTVVSMEDFMREKYQYDMYSLGPAALPKGIRDLLNTLPLTDLTTPNRLGDQAQRDKAVLSNATQFPPIRLEEGYLFGHGQFDLKNSRGAFYFNRNALPKFVVQCYDEACNPTRKDVPIVLNKEATDELTKPGGPFEKFTRVEAYVQPNGNIYLYGATESKTEKGKFIPDGASLRLFNPMNFCTLMRLVNEKPADAKVDYTSPLPAAAPKPKTPAELFAELNKEGWKQPWARAVFSEAHLDKEGRPRPGKKP